MIANTNVIEASERSTNPSAADIDRALRSLAQQQAAIDADEAHWLRAAEAQKAWPQLGYVHALEYLEDVFGYAPRTAMERLRVARELGDLPQLEDALRCGELSYSVVRELTRVATPETVERWLEQARGRRFRDVEQAVSGRKKGDNPDDMPDPARVKHRVVLELDGESLAIWRQMKQSVEVALEQSLDDRSFVLALGERILCDENSNSSAPGNDNDIVGDMVDDATAPTSNATTGRAKPTLRKVLARHMIHITTCRSCAGVWQDGAGVRVRVDRSVLERAQCNAIVCDDEKGERPSRTIPAHIERLVLERAQHRCQVPGCRSSKHLTIHHIKFWSHGGDHDPSNLNVLCDGHHRLLHDGRLHITGRMPDQVVITRNGVRLRGADELGVDLPPREPHALRKHARPSPAKKVAGELRDDVVAQAQQALRQLGFKPGEAARGVEAAAAQVGNEVELAVLIKEALKHCK